jgi:hypothetical protein
MLCALAALSAEVEVAEDAAACPAALCPEWMAHVVVYADDNVSDEAHRRLMLALGESARRWPALNADAWERIRRAWLCSVLDEAASHITVDDWGVREAIAKVQAALRGDLEVARAAAGAAAEAAYAAAYAAWAASHITVDDWGVREAIAKVQAALRGDGDLEVARAAAEAAYAAAYAAWAEAAAEAAAARAAWGAAYAAETAAGDRMTETLIKEINTEL